MTPLDDRVACIYSRIVGDERSEFTYAVPVSLTTPNYGGQRAWLHCSSAGCGRRCARLFLEDPYLVCTGCADLRYPSQVDPQPEHRKWAERAKSLRARLGGMPMLFQPLPPRPKGMHRSTYERLIDEIETLEWLVRQRDGERVVTGEASLRTFIAREIEKGLSKD